MTQNITDMTAWCRAWNDEPGLIEGLVTDDVRVWLGHFGTIEKPNGLTAFVQGYREAEGVRFAPELLIEDGENLGFVWRATLRGGEQLTGLDVWALRGGRISDVWSVAGEVTAGLPLDVSERTDRATIEATVARWLPMWNGEVAPAELVSDDFRIWFTAGRRVETRPAFTEFLAGYREERPDIRFAVHRPPVIDEEHGRAALVWSVTRPSTGLELAGIDVFAFRGGRIGQVWSVTGTVGL